MIWFLFRLLTEILLSQKADDSVNFDASEPVVIVGFGQKAQVEFVHRLIFIDFYLY